MIVLLLYVSLTLMQTNVVFLLVLHLNSLMKAGTRSQMKNVNLFKKVVDSKV